MMGSEANQSGKGSVATGGSEAPTLPSAVRRWPPKWLLDSPKARKQNAKFAHWMHDWMLPIGEWFVRVCELLLLVIAMSAVAEFTKSWLALVLNVGLKLICVGYFLGGIWSGFLRIMSLRQWKTSCPVTLLVLLIVTGATLGFMELQFQMQNLIDAAVKSNLKDMPTQTELSTPSERTGTNQKVPGD
jgi:hypothetical protein